MTPIASKPLPDGHALEVWPLTFGRARLSLVLVVDGEPYPDLLDGW
jgi:hypothetical protein